MAVKFKKSQFLTKNDYTVRLTDSISCYWKEAIYSKTIFRVRIEIRLTTRGPIYTGQSPILEIS